MVPMVEPPRGGGQGLPSSAQPDTCCHPSSRARGSSASRASTSGRTRSTCWRTRSAAGATAVRSLAFTRVSALTHAKRGELPVELGPAHPAPGPVSRRVSPRLHHLVVAPPAPGRSRTMRRSPRASGYRCEPHDAPGIVLDLVEPLRPHRAVELPHVPESVGGVPPVGPHGRRDGRAAELLIDRGRQRLRLEEVLPEPAALPVEVIPHGRGGVREARELRSDAGEAPPLRRGGLHDHVVIGAAEVRDLGPRAGAPRCPAAVPPRVVLRLVDDDAAPGHDPESRPGQRAETGTTGTRKEHVPHHSRPGGRRAARRRASGVR